MLNDLVLVIGLVIVNIRIVGIELKLVVIEVERWYKENLVVWVGKMFCVF